MLDIYYLSIYFYILESVPFPRLWPLKQPQVAHKTPGGVQSCPPTDFDMFQTSSCAVPVSPPEGRLQDRGAVFSMTPSPAPAQHRF